MRPEPEPEPEPPISAYPHVGVGSGWEGVSWSRREGGKEMKLSEPHSVISMNYH